MNYQLSTTKLSIIWFLDQAEGHIKKLLWSRLLWRLNCQKQLAPLQKERFRQWWMMILLPSAKLWFENTYRKNDALNHLDAQVFADVLSGRNNSWRNWWYFSNNLSGKAVAPRLSAKLKAGLVSGACGAARYQQWFCGKENVFSGKAFCQHHGKQCNQDVIALNPNSYNITETGGTAWSDWIKRNSSGSKNCRDRRIKLWAWNSHWVKQSWWSAADVD